MSNQLNSSKKYHALIFDFDGTLVDSLELHRKLFNILAQKYGKPELTSESLEQFRHTSAREFISTLGIPFYKLPRLLDEGRQLLEKNFEELSLFPGTRDMLKELVQHKNLAVASSTPESILRAVLQKEGVDHLFTDIRSERNLFGKHRLLKKILHRHGWEAEACLYIGDEVRDLQAAHKAGMEFLGVGWGFNASSRLQEEGAHVCNRPIEILTRLLTSSY